jgi:hypothetical protein
MKPEHKNLSPTELALITWYAPNHPLHKDPKHPTLKLAGEIGELLDLYAKDKFKPGFDWMRCKNCNTCHKLNAHLLGGEGNCIDYMPSVLSELSDIWYYLRILAWMYETGFTEESMSWYDTPDAIKNMYHHADNILNGGSHNHREYEICYRLQSIFDNLINLLEQLDFTLEELTELNYRKLNSEETNHGWKGA